MIQRRDFSGAELMHIPVMETDRDALLACPPLAWLSCIEALDAALAGLTGEG